MQAKCHEAMGDYDKAMQAMILAKVRYSPNALWTTSLGSHAFSNATAITHTLLAKSRRICSASRPTRARTMQRPRRIRLHSRLRPCRSLAPQHLSPSITSRLPQGATFLLCRSASAKAIICCLCGNYHR